MIGETSFCPSILVLYCNPHHTVVLLLKFEDVNVLDLFVYNLTWLNTWSRSLLGSISTIAEAPFDIPSPLTITLGKG